jgi:peptide/nickel transport system substrate-binding protein
VSGSGLLRSLIALALTLAACTTGPAQHEPSTIVIAWQDPETLNPLYSTGNQTNALVYRVAVEGLLAPGPAGCCIPVLAEQVPSLSNGGVVLLPDGRMEVRYRLRERTWSDGTAFDSGDVRFTWSLIMSDPKVASREGYDQIEGVDTPDARTAVVRYRTSYPAFLTRFDAILPRHTLEATRDLSEYSRFPLGTGPFRITENNAGDHITAERNARYDKTGKLPFLDRIVFRSVPSLEAAKAQLKAGEVQAAPSLGDADVADLRGAPGVRLEIYRSPSVETLQFNLAKPGNPADPAVAHPVLGDVAVRRALLLATPKQLMVDTLLGGTPPVGRSELPLGWREASAIAQESYDPDAAGRLLDAAGWPVGADGVRAKAGVRASLTVVSTTGNQLRERIEQVLIDQWRRIGVELRIRNVPSATLVGSWSSGGIRKRGDFDVMLAQQGLGGLGGNDPQSYLAQRHRCDAIPRAANNGAGANYERFCDKRIDDLLARAAAATDDGTRDRAYADVMRIVNDNVLDIWLYDRSRVDAYRDSVSGTSGIAWDVPTWNVAQWQLAKK